MADELWKDPDFPADNTVLTAKYRTATDVIWKRPKDIVDNPQFIVEGVSIDDVDQGTLGDCWVLAAVACGVTHPKQFQHCVPTDQSFGDHYTGKFRFNLWKGGEWSEVLVDDRLPTKGGRLLYGRNKFQKNEFWMPLFEKAFAKFYGSYQHIQGGFVCNALVNLTGGVSESIDMGRPDVIPDINHDELFLLVTIAIARSSLLACDVAAPMPKAGAPPEVKANNGLHYNHEYSITDVEQFDVKGKKTRLIRIRNPWGYGEWNGKWSDGSAEWDDVSEEDKKKICLERKDDGEFWMEFQDFISFYQNVRFCHVPPGEGQDADLWRAVIINDVIEKGSAQGAKKHEIEVAPVSDSNGKPINEVHVLVSLLQTEIRLDLLPCLVDLYEPISKTWMKAVDLKTAYDNLREMTQHFLVPAGKYLVVPNSYFDPPPRDIKYLLRVLIETGVSDQYMHIR